MAITRIITPGVTDDAVTLDKMAPGNDGNLITYDASGNPAAVATGSAGQVLTSAGAGAPPTFATAGSGTFRNIMINGDMSIAQRGTSVTGNTAGGYLTCDRWNFNVFILHTIFVWNFISIVIFFFPTIPIATVKSL